MQFLAILIVSTALAALVGRRKGGWRDHSRRGFAVAMVIAGVGHFANSEPFVQHLPDWVPAREALVYITGAFEIALGAALLFSKTHRAAVGRLVAAFLVAVFPANVYVAVAHVDVSGQPGGVHAWIRLPLQLLFIGWALFSTGPHTVHPVRRPTAPSSESVPQLAT
jgi:uncharacterized membrane protein